MAAAETSGIPKKRGRPASTPEDREKQLQNKAFDLAEKQLDNGTASSQVISMLLKGGGVRAQMEREKIETENRLLRARIDGMEAAARMTASIEEALEAFRTYSGESTDEPED